MGKMNAPTEKRRITIIGLGLIGGSIGLRLKQADLPALEIVGQDRERSAERTAEKMGAIDRAEHDPKKAVQGANLVIISTPITALREVFNEIGANLAEGAVVTDTASTKGEVMRWAAAILPETVSFVGGHPMAGKETQGIDHADAALFEGRAYCVCPTVNSSQNAIKSVMGLAELLGAEPMFIDADEHDVYAAAISHLPLITATAMFSLMRQSPSWEDLGQLASSGFRDMTRLASGEPAMSQAIWSTNREPLIHWIDRLTDELNRLRDMLKDSQDEDLFAMFATAKLQRDEFLANPPKRAPRPDGVEVDRGKAFLDLIVGGMMADNIRRIQKIPEIVSEEATEEGGTRRVTRLEKMSEDIRRDLEKLDQEREEKARREQEG